MKFHEEVDFLKEVLNGDLTQEAQINVLFEILNNVLDQGAVRARTVKYKLQKYVNSPNVCERAYALEMIASDGKGRDTIPSEDEVDNTIENTVDWISEELANSPNVCERAYALEMIASDGKGRDTIPSEDEVDNTIENTVDWISEELARKYVQSQIEAKVEKNIMDKQEKYIDEVRLSVIKKQKGSENSKTNKKYEELIHLDEKKTNKNIMSFLRPENFSEVVGQDRAIKSLISKLSSPYPQHIILYGPPGGGKTTAARIALEEARRLSFTPFDDESKFVEVKIELLNH